ncbi:MAG TPA: DsbA family protein [Methylomirabilota bacterium]|nr:DsbA family protein [Methylomirabilota bacterium]
MIARLARPLALAAMLGAATFGTPAAAEDLSPEQKAEIEALVRDYILENPEIIQEALVNLEERRKAEEAEARTAAVSSMSDILYSSKRQVTLGDPNAPITLVEFFDYNCGYCKRALDDTIALLENDDVKIVLKEMPILGPGSVEAARVGIAVNLVAPDSYLEFHRELLTGSGQADERRALAVVEDIGLDVEKVRTAMKDPEVASTIEEVYSIANRLGLTGTPSYVIGDEVVFGAVGSGALQARIDAIRDCGETTC